MMSAYMFHVIQVVSQSDPAVVLRLQLFITVDFLHFKRILQRRFLASLVLCLSLLKCFYHIFEIAHKHLCSFKSLSYTRA